MNLSQHSPTTSTYVAYRSRAAGPFLKMSNMATTDAKSGQPNRNETTPTPVTADPFSQTPVDSNIESLNAVAEEIVTSLKFPEGTARTAPIPEFELLVDLINRLKAIVYPGFRSNESSPEKVLTELKSQLVDLHHILSRQIAIAIARHYEACEDMAHSDCGETGTSDIGAKLECIATHSKELASKYIAMMPRIRESLLTDVKAAYVGDPACKNLDEVILCYPGLNAITVYRLAHELHLLKVPFLPRMMTEWVHGETGVDIHPGATISDHFFIDHGTGVVIGETCIIGEHVKIYQGVTLGALSFPQDEMGQLIRDSKRHPTIEDNVVIYANATVLGGKTVVGRDSVVGSSVWLTHSVDPSTTVIMEKPKLRLRNQVKTDFEPPMDFQI
ncbi:MAG: serine O-acetyltransferase [Mariniblastus sp.]